MSVCLAFLAEAAPAIDAVCYIETHLHGEKLHEVICKASPLGYRAFAYECSFPRPGPQRKTEGLEEECKQGHPSLRTQVQVR